MNIEQFAYWLDHRLAQRTIVLALAGGQYQTGAQAISSIIARTGGILGVMARPFTLKPMSLMLEPGYRVFARHRGRLASRFPDPPDDSP